MVESPIDEADIFQRAREIASPDHRATYLREACGGNAELHVRVVALLKAAEEESSFLEPSPLAFAATRDMPSDRERVGANIGPYKLLEQIGEGGFGIVFMAEQQQPVRRKVALKILKPGMDTRQVIARFEAERQALALMEHPHIAKVLDAGATEAGRPYFVMELVRGIPITEYCEQSRLDTRERLALFIDVCHAVQHAHQKGIIHRDLKPSNVLVTQVDGKPMVKVIDFGIAKATGQQLTDKTLFTGFAQLIGTPLYMSPEQAALSGVDVDTRSDVYSLGVMLYELLTGTTPFTKETFSNVSYDELRRIIREDEPPRPSARLSTLQANADLTQKTRQLVDLQRLSRQLRGDLDWIVMRALEKDRSRRYESTTAFAADIQRYLNDEPVLACPPSTVYRLGKFLRRHKSGVAAAGLVALVLAVALSAGVTLSAQRASARRRMTELVQQSLVAARTAIEAGDLVLAGQGVAEARGHLGDQRGEVAPEAVEIQKLAAELEARQKDRQSFERFLARTREAQDRLGEDPTGHLVRARNALSEFAIETNPGWWERLERSYLTLEQQQQVRELAYELLVTLAGDFTRWNTERTNDPQAYSRSLAFLNKAKAFHEPTRAYWFVRWSTCLRLKHDVAAKEAEQYFQAAKATTAWDHYLPANLGWAAAGNPIQACQAALRVQPDHFASLSFLADRLSHDVNRRPEAIAYYSACIALRPTAPGPYEGRARCHEKLGHLEEAEADFSAAIATVTTDERRFWAYKNRCGFYDRVKRQELADADLQQVRMIAARVLAQLNDNQRGKKPSGSSQKEDSLSEQLRLASVRYIRFNLAARYGSSAVSIQEIPGRSAEAEKLLLEAIAINEQLVAGSPTFHDRDNLAAELHNLGNLYVEIIGRPLDGERAYRRSHELYAGLASELPKKQRYRFRLTASLGGLVEALIDCGKLDEAQSAAQERLVQVEKNITEFPTAQEHRHSFLSAHANLGMVQHRRGDYTAAAESLAKALNNDGIVNLTAVGVVSVQYVHPPDVLFYMAMAQAQLGNEAKSQAAFDEAVDVITRHELKSPKVLRLRAEAEALLMKNPGDLDRN